MSWRARTSLERAILRDIERTRSYASRQRTWFRAEPDIHWLPPGPRVRRGRPAVSPDLGVWSDGMMTIMSSPDATSRDGRRNGAAAPHPAPRTPPGQD